MRRFPMRFFCVVLILGAYLPQPAQAAGPATVAVVDLVTLIQNHPDAKTLNQRFEQAKEKAMDSWKVAQERLKSLLEEIKKLPHNDPQRRLKEKQYESQKTHNEFARRWAEREAVTDYVHALERIYADVVVKVNTYARNNNIQLVLQRETKPEKIVGASVDDFFVKLRLRKVLFSAPELDITAQVQAMLVK